MSDCHFPSSQPIDLDELSSLNDRAINSFLLERHVSHDYAHFLPTRNSAKIPVARALFSCLSQSTPYSALSCLVFDLLLFLPSACHA